jgi:hypothetical protein
MLVLSPASFFVAEKVTINAPSTFVKATCFEALVAVDSCLEPPILPSIVAS